MLTMLRFKFDDMANDMPVDAGESEVSLPEGVTSSCRLATGRSALAHLIPRLPLGTRVPVLMPCYVPEGVIAPFRRAGADIRFYRLGPDLTPDVDHLEDALRAARESVAVVLIHYFGFSAWSDQLRCLLGAHDTVVIEDCAHAPLSTVGGQPLAKEGDVVLYSLNKFLPVTDGAILISRREDIDVSVRADELTEMSATALSAYNRHLAACRTLYDCHSTTEVEPILKEVARSYEDYYGEINSDLAPHAQSLASREFERRFSFARCSERRRRNAEILYDHWDTDVVRLVHPALPNGVVPFGIPARVPAEQRSAIIATLMEKDVLLSTLVDKWQFIPENQADSFPMETAFIEDHVLIPVSEYISDDEMLQIARAINSVQPDRFVQCPMQP